MVTELYLDFEPTTKDHQDLVEKLERSLRLFIFPYSKITKSKLLNATKKDSRVRDFMVVEHSLVNQSVLFVEQI